MRPTLIVLLLAFVVSGCATAAHVRLAPEDRARLAGEAVAVVQDQPAGLVPPR